MTGISRKRLISFGSLLLLELSVAAAVLFGVLWETCDTGMRPFVLTMVFIFGPLTLFLSTKGALVLLAMIAIDLISVPLWSKLLDKKFGLVLALVGSPIIIIAAAAVSEAWLSGYGTHPIHGNCVL